MGWDKPLKLVLHDKQNTVIYLHFDFPIQIYIHNPDKYIEFHEVGINVHGEYFGMEYDTAEERDADYAYILNAIDEYFEIHCKH